MSVRFRICLDTLRNVSGRIIIIVICYSKFGAPWRRQGPGPAVRRRPLRQIHVFSLQEYGKIRENQTMYNKQ